MCVISKFIRMASICAFLLVFFDTSVYGSEQPESQILVYKSKIEAANSLSDLSDIFVQIEGLPRNQTTSSNALEEISILLVQRGASLVRRQNANFDNSFCNRSLAEVCYYIGLTVGSSVVPEAYGAFFWNYASDGKLNSVPEFNSSIDPVRGELSNRMLNPVTLGSVKSKPIPNDLNWSSRHSREIIRKRASDLLREAAVHAEARGDYGLYVKIKANEAKLHSRSNSSEARVAISEAINKYNDSLGLLEGHNNDLAIDLADAAVTLLTNTADSQVSENEIAYIEKILQQALNTTESARRKAYIHGLRGQLHALRGNHELAITDTEHALLMSTQGTAPEVEYVWNAQLGILLSQTGKSDQAKVAFDRAVSNIEQVRSHLTQDKSYTALTPSRVMIEPVVKAYASFLTRNGNLEAALEVNQRLNNIEFEEYLNDVCVLERSQDQKKVWEVDEKAAIISPLVFGDRLELIVSLKRPNNPHRLIPVGVSRERLELLVDVVLRGLSNGKSESVSEELSELYRYLILPTQDVLTAEGNIDTIVFAPDGFLRGVPLSALQDTNGKYLVENYAVAYVNDLTLSNPKPFFDIQPQGVFAGISEALTLPNSLSAFSPLEWVTEEIKGIDRQIDGINLEDKDFSKRELEKVLTYNKFNVLHLSTHAEFTENAKDSYILLHSGKKTNDSIHYGEKLTIDELYEITLKSRIKNKPIELMSLSACETGLGNAHAESNNGILGLSGVAYRAGAKSVVGSLWKVNDQSTNELMVEFYSNLASVKFTKLSKAEALREAQLKLLKEGCTESQTKCRDPYHWASFVILGNWL